MRARFGQLFATLEAAAQHEMGVVIGRRELQYDAELGLGLDKPVDPEVRDAQRLSNRSLAWLGPLRFLERDGRLRAQTVLEVLLTLLEVSIRIRHTTVTIEREDADSDWPCEALATIGQAQPGEAQDATHAPHGSDSLA